jgi:pimeloyl-ACP methyl ester carboxylesterase
MTKTIMLIHGAWLNSKGWENWKARCEAKGYTVVAPDWPHDAGEPADLRANPRKELTMFVQHLLDRGLGVAGVSIDPAPTPGVGLGLDTIISAFPVLGDPFSGGKVVQMSKKFFANRFANGLPRNMVEDHYNRYIVPTAGKVYWDGVLSGGAGKITWNSSVRAPLLLIAGGIDKIAEPGMTRAIFNKQKRARSLTEFKLYPTRSHWTCAEPGWEEVADFAFDWAVKNARPNGATVTPLKAAAA